MSANIVHTCRTDRPQDPENWRERLLGASVYRVEEGQNGNLRLEMDCGISLIVCGGLVMVHNLPQ